MFHQFAQKDFVYCYPCRHVIYVRCAFIRLFLDLHGRGMRVLGPHVEHLSLKNSSILEKTFIEILKYCENLTVCSMLLFESIRAFMDFNCTSS